MRVICGAYNPLAAPRLHWTRDGLRTRFGNVAGMAASRLGGNSPGSCLTSAPKTTEAQAEHCLSPQRRCVSGRSCAAVRAPFTGTAFVCVSSGGHRGPAKTTRPTFGQPSSRREASTVLRNRGPTGMSADVFSNLREVVVIPNEKWGGSGLLGCGVG